MSVVQEMQSQARVIQQRLRNPPNAVMDQGINLKRKPEPVRLVPDASLDVFGPKPPTPDDIAFGPVVCPPLPAPSRIEAIQRAVMRKYNLTRMELISSRRTGDIVRPRQIAMYLCKLLTPRSLPEIGMRFGGKDHTTVLNAVRKIEAQREQDPILNAEVLDLIEAIAEPRH